MKTPERAISTRVSRETIRRMLSLAAQFDVEKGGLCDGRSGVVNFWCSAEDKPKGWDVEITRGAFPQPRAYVGGLYWEPVDKEELNGDWVLHLDAAPYDLLPDKFRYQWDKVPKEMLENIFDWLEEKADWLVRLAETAPTELGTECPFCSWYLPAGSVLNILLEHVRKSHPEVSINGLMLGTSTVLKTAFGDFELKTKTGHSEG